jgi:hypothetical protein
VRKIVQLYIVNISVAFNNSSVDLCQNFKMGKKNNSYTASYKLKVISLAEQFGNRAAQR